MKLPENIIAVFVSKVNRSKTKKFEYFQEFVYESFIPDFVNF